MVRAGRGIQDLRLGTMGSVMNRVLVGFVILFAVLAQAATHELPLANKGPKGLRAGTIDEMLALPDEEIDIGLGALLIGKEYDPNLDVPKYLAQLDTMALELRARVRNEKDPEKVIAKINHYIFTERGYVALKDDQSEARDFLLSMLLQRKKGQCASLSTLYLALAERLGLPLLGVSAPRHLFVRWVSSDRKINIETTNKGTSLSESQYVSRFHVPETAGGRAFYMRNLTKRQFMGVLLYNLGVAYSAQSRTKESIRAYKKGLAVNPNDAVAWYGLGLACVRRGNLDEAIQACKRALAIAPNSDRAWANLGVAYSAQGKLNDAMRAFRKALALNPKLAGAWTNLGVAYANQGRLKKAVKAHRKALAIDASGAVAWANLGMAYRGQRRFDQAIRAFKKAVAAHPNFAGAWYNLAIAFYGKADYASAWSCIQKCRELRYEVPSDFLINIRAKMKQPEQ